MASRTETPPSSGSGDGSEGMQGCKAPTQPGETRKGKLPEHLYDELRKAANRKRKEKFKHNKKARMEQQRQQEEEALAGLPEEERARLAQERAAKEQEESAARIKAHIDQLEKVQAALEGGLRVVVDCSFTSLCSPKELRSLAKQLETSAGLNKRAAAPVALTYTSFTGAIAESSRSMGSSGWKAHLLPQSLLEAFPAAQVVVLSPDADEPLLELRQGHVYCIGGIVDRSVKKHVTLKFAEEQRMVARRLPVLEFADRLGLGAGTCRRPVLNVNDVVLALLEFHASGDWVKALDVAIPGRKRKQPGGPPAGARQAPVERPAEPGGEGVSAAVQPGAASVAASSPASAMATPEGAAAHQCSALSGDKTGEQQNAGPRPEAAEMLSPNIG